jgi:hypothetical protein
LTIEFLIENALTCIADVTATICGGEVSFLLASSDS